MSRDARVNRKGEKPASSPSLDSELRFRKSARLGPPDPERDRPPISTFPGTPPKTHEGQLQLQ